MMFKNPSREINEELAKAKQQFVMINAFDNKRFALEKAIELASFTGNFDETEITAVAQKLYDFIIV